MIICVGIGFLTPNSGLTLLKTDKCNNSHVELVNTSSCIIYDQYLLLNSAQLFKTNDVIC